MISPFAVKEFLNRTLESYDWLKTLSDDQLDEIINSLNPKPSFTTTPHDCQKACFIIGAHIYEFLFFLDMGLGKTKLILDLISYHKDKTGLLTKPALVLVPNVINIETWPDEIEEHNYKNLECIPLYSEDDRWKKIEEEGDLFIIPYQGLVALVTDSKKSKDEDVEKRTWQINKTKVDKIRKRFGALIFDESTSLGNHRSLTYRICNSLTKTIPIRYSLTGTPFGKDPQMMWSQFYSIDKGETLGNTLGIFREAFFHTKKNYWGGYEYTFDKTMKTQLHETIKNRSIGYEEDESNLPPVIDNEIHLKFPITTMQYYKKVVADFKASNQDQKQRRNSFIQMRQLASGYLKIKGEKGQKDTYIIFKENPKLDATLQRISELPPKRKMIIFNEYIKTGNIIAKALKKAKIKYCRIYSKTKKKRDKLKKFKNNSDVQILLLNNSSGSKGSNFQHANYTVYFESPTSPITRLQGRKRTYRRRQTRTTFFTDLIMLGSQDQRILDSIVEGEDLMNSVIKGWESPI